jgi:uncharacterized protein YndB with AHSA1/START domain
MQTSETMRIERSTFIRAPRSRVWKAVSDPAQFGAWFQAKAEGEFTPGNRVRVTMQHPSCPGLAFSITIDQVVPEQSISWHWHPGAVIDTDEPPTRVEFLLADAEGGTTVTVIESGFERLSLAKRAAAFEDNSKGWEEQLQNLSRYLVHEA